MKMLEESVAAEKAEQGENGGDGSSWTRIKEALDNKIVRRGLYAGITVQVAQQFVGINTVMYYSPTIVQFAGFASNKTALALSLITSGLNAVGSIVSMACVDRFGRRRLMIISMFGIITCLVVLSVLFFQVSVHSPMISHTDSIGFGGNTTCPAYLSSQNPGKWNCMTCLKATDCGFCASSVNEVRSSLFPPWSLHLIFFFQTKTCAFAMQYGPGACLSSLTNVKGACSAKDRVWFTQGCPTKFGIFAVLLLGLYIICYSPGMGTVPWIVNSEIYPLRYRGVGGGMAAVSNWVSNLIVSETFLTLTERLGSAGTFLLFAGFSTIGLVFIFLLVPETKGLAFEEVEKMLDKGYRPSLCGGGDDSKDEDKKVNTV